MKGISMESKELIALALAARENAYAPYSGFRVGAALLCKDGTVYQGCNVENAAYGPSNCAERTAIFKAVSEGKQDFAKIAIVGGLKDTKTFEYCPPCGVCRQVMMEFVNPKTFEIILWAGGDQIKTVTLDELFPMGFGPDNLGK